MHRILAVTGCLLAATAVAAGAFGAHALRDLASPASLDIFETACRYHMYHALALLFLAWASTRPARSQTLLYAGAWGFIGGIVLFSGSLYLYVLSETRWLVYLTPIGGTLFIAGWVVSVLHILRLPKPSNTE